MKINNIFYKFISIFFFLLFSWIFVLLTFFNRSIDYLGKKDFFINNVWILIIGLVLIIGLKVINNKKKLEINFDKVVYIVLFILFFIQLYIFYLGFFETGWDSKLIVDNAYSMFLGMEIPSIGYYSHYPNNILYTLIVQKLFKINSNIGFYTPEYMGMSVVFVNCIISSISSLLVYKIGKKLFSKNIAFVGYIASVLLFVLSPWNIIIYTDSFALFIPITILYIYLSDWMKSYFKIPIILLLSYIGFSLKPYTVIITIAIGMVEFIKLLIGGEFKKNVINFIIMVASIIIVFFINTGLNNYYYNRGFVLNNDAKFGITHFLMMGANESSNGGYSEEDVLLSSKQPDTKTRNSENVKVYLERLKEYGLIGYSQLLSKKILTAYNDGTFAWMKEGNFISVEHQNISDIASDIKNIIYGDNNKYWGMVVHFVWIICLLFAFYGIIINLRSKDIDYIYLILILSIIGLTVYELLFEVRARYLYVYVPIYILLMMYGINSIKYNNRKKATRDEKK